VRQAQAYRWVFFGLLAFIAVMVSAVGTRAAEPWADARRTPLTHSLCRHVVTTGRPLVLTDARQDPLTRASPAVPGLGVVGYAGMLFE